MWNVGNTRPPQNLRQFDGDEVEKTYLIYFATGDLHTYRHGTKVRAEGSTTHPAQLELLGELFGRYARPIFEAFRTPNAHFAIRATYDLPPSFDFLLRKSRRIGAEILKSDALFYSALSGFSDAEGHVGLWRSGEKARARFLVSNRNIRLLKDFKEGLASRGLIGGVHTMNLPEGEMYTLGMRLAFVPNSLSKIRFRHREKIAAKEMALSHDGSPWGVAGPLYKSFRRGIRAERDALELIAQRQFELKPERKLRKKGIFKQKVELTFGLFSKGASVEQVSEAFNFSIRTAYRRKQEFRKASRFDSAVSET